MVVRLYQSTAQPGLRGTAVIVGSLLLILLSIGLLAYGLMRGSNPYLIGSVAASLLAAVALIAGGRQAARAGAVAERAEEPVEEEPPGSARSRRRAGRSPVVEDVALPGEPVEVEPVDAERVEVEPVAEPAVAEPVGLDYDDDEDYGDDEPPDEPPPQQLSPADAARVARMDDEVLVVDGRPRYHRQGCEHLRGRQVEPLPVSEAVELGFTPCDRCSAGTELLAQARTG
jgi:hypothetical protein